MDQPVCANGAFEYSCWHNLPVMLTVAMYLAQIMLGIGGAEEKLKRGLEAVRMTWQDE